MKGSLNIILRKFNNCSLKEQLHIREIRNQKTIRSSMYTDHIIGLNEHLKWISNIKSDNSQIVFVVFDFNENPIGLVRLMDIDRLHKKADWGYFIDEKKKGGLGAVLEYNFLNFVFTKLNLEKLNCEVLETNPTVIKLHKKFLFQEEGFRRSNINQNDVRIGVHFLGLTKDEWLEGFSSVYTKYQSAFEKYNVVIETKDKKRDETLSLT